MAIPSSDALLRRFERRFDGLVSFPAPHVPWLAG